MIYKLSPTVVNFDVNSAQRDTNHDLVKCVISTYRWNTSQTPLKHLSKYADDVIFTVELSNIAGDSFN